MWLGWVGIAVNCGFGFSRKIVRATDTLTVYASLFTHIQRNITLHAIYRVHWLRAKAQKMRWIEELQCLQVEMGSAVRFFRHQE
ncbi:hypothetical protein BJY52DRAFT_1131837 [Lactarius psammicola]|nr:hypothetical protein BJY52DRAFT_1133208 [Lactarius psammicola]KAI9433689.1 hypothetical protein BJY52DRAFT_1132091 [Lactarius psammicola]KAI9434126.1 hypothetical protein BJY52DRAFT_1131837 [Lactarius psammicola]